MADNAESNRKYQERVEKGLNEAFKRADEDTLALDRDQVVIFSDHHRGDRDGADDFWRCERAYHAALAYYLHHKYKLILLGDVEELWENKPNKPLESYSKTLALEGKFHPGRLERFWGNHDDAWRHEGEVKKHLHGPFPGLTVREALRLKVTDGGEPVGTIFLVHGHQGTLDSDRWSFVSRFFVRYGWRPIQRRFKMASTTPARSFALRAAHDQAMFRWALERKRDERLVLIAGHTHRPVFSSPKPSPERSAEEVNEELVALQAQENPDQERIAELYAELEFVATPPFEEPPKEMPVPCYFNTGCCSFGDGDITGIEIGGGEIRLVRWLNDKYEPRKKQLADPRNVREVFAAVVAERP